MNSRILGIKKTTLLRASIGTAFLYFVLSTALFLFYFKIFEFWFYNFCISLSIFELAKGFLFKLDSSLYFGFLLLFMGVSGYIFWFTETTEFALFYIFTAFCLASILTYLKTGQKFHLVFSYSIIFVTIFGVLLKKNLITWPIFIAFIGLFLLLLILEIIIFFKRRNWYVFTRI